MTDPGRRRAGPPGAAGRALPRALAVALLVALVAALALAAGRLLPLAEALRALRGLLEGLGPLAPLLFVLVFAVATLLLLPGSPLSVTAGAVFGLGLGAVSAFAGAVLASTAALLLARGLLRPRVERWIGAHPRLRAVDELLARRGPLVACLLRLTPALPFGLLSYALGLTRLSVRGSLLSCLAMIPGTLLYVGAGAAAGEAVAGAPRGAWALVLPLLGVGAALGVSVALGRVAARALPPPGAPPPDQGREGEREETQPSS